MGRRKKKSREEREEADRKFKAQPRNKRSKILAWFRRHRDPQTAVVPLAESSEGFSQLVLEGRFLEACRSISSLAEDRQDRGSQYQMVAQGMWQVIREALEGGGGSQELQRKLRSVAATVEWARGSSRELGDDLASWDCQLRTQLRNDAENRVPPSPRDRVPLSPGDQLGGYLAELARAVDRGLDPQRAGWLGACLSATDRECFQEVLLDRLSMLLTCSGDPDSCRELYTWARKTLFGQLVKMPEPAATRKLSDPLMFVTWMSQVQSRLVELVQKELEKQLEDVLTCDQKESATSSCQAFLKIFQLLKGTIDSVQDIGPPITSRVQAMVLNTFSEFLKRKTWQSLGQAHTPLADVVLRTISAIEDRSQDDLVSVVRSQYRSLLGHHFGREDEGLAQALRSLRWGLEHYPSLLPPPTYKSLVQSLYKAVFTEYLQALVTHLKRLKPRKWEDHRGQVETDFRELHEAFGRQEGLGDGAPGREAFMEVFQLSEKQGNPCLDEWLDSFRDSSPDYVGRESKAREGKDLPRVPCRPVQPPHWSLCLLTLRSTQLDPRSGPVQIPSRCPGLPAHRAGPRILGSGAAALAPGASSRLSQRDRGCEGCGAFSRDAGARHHCLGREPSCLFPGKRLHGRGPASWRRTSLMSGGPDRRLSPSSRRPVARWPPQVEVEVSTHFREPLPLGLWTSCGSGTQLRRRMCVPPAASQAAV